LFTESKTDIPPEHSGRNQHRSRKVHVPAVLWIIAFKMSTILHGENACIVWYQHRQHNMNSG